MKLFNDNELKVYKKWGWLMILVIVILLFVSCNKDDDSTNFTISITNSTFTTTGINNCTVTIGTGTILLVETPYEASDEQTIEQLLVKTTVSNGETEDNVVTTFQDDGSAIVIANCFHFGSQDWVEFEIRLESNQGAVSNASTIRIDRPTGAE